MKTKLLFALTLLVIFALNAQFAQAQSAVFHQPSYGRRSRPFFPNGVNLPVVGDGTTGQLTMWTGINGTNSYIGDSIITQTKFGLIGIGTTTPTSLLTVHGMIETTLGGVKFPDGTVQTTAGLNSIFHDLTLTGNGSSGSPLGIAPGGVGALQLGTGAVTPAKIAPFTVVRSIGGVTDDVALLAGPNISIDLSANAFTIGAPGVLTGVAHDSTLTGDGTAGSPLAVAASTESSAAFFSNQDLTAPNGANLNDPGKDVVSKTVPAGSYAIFATIGVFNDDNDDQNLVCSLSTGASNLVRVPALTTGGEGASSITLQDVATFNTQTTIKVHCTGFNITTQLFENVNPPIQRVFLTAIKVGSIQ